MHIKKNRSEIYIGRIVKNFPIKNSIFVHFLSMSSKKLVVVSGATGTVRTVHWNRLFYAPQNCKSRENDRDY